LVNPTWSKLRQCAFEGGPPEHTGRALEAVGNGCPRWMTVTGGLVTASRDRTRRIGRLIHFTLLTCGFVRGGWRPGRRGLLSDLEDE